MEENVAQSVTASSVQVAVWAEMAAELSVEIAGAEVESAAAALPDTAGGVTACVPADGPRSPPRSQASRHRWDRCKTPAHASAGAPGGVAEK